MGKPYYERTIKEAFKDREHGFSFNGYGIFINGEQRKDIKMLEEIAEKYNNYYIWGNIKGWMFISAFNNPNDMAISIASFLEEQKDEKDDNHIEYVIKNGEFVRFRVSVSFDEKIDPDTNDYEYWEEEKKRRIY